MFTVLFLLTCASSFEGEGQDEEESWSANDYHQSLAANWNWTDWSVRQEWQTAEWCSAQQVEEHPVDVGLYAEGRGRW